MENKMQVSGLFKKAVEAMGKAYVPYSHFKVGAALLTKTGEVFQGCNIENAAYSVCNCAERTAFFNAVSAGYYDFSAICIVGGKEGILTDYTSPCGVCRQVMMEFCDPKTFRVILGKSEEDYRIYTLEDLLPSGFGKASLKDGD